MSQENVELVRATFRSLGRRRLRGVLRACDEHVEITQPAELLGVADISTATRDA